MIPAFIVPILTADEPTINRRIYPLSVLKDIVATIPNTPYCGQIGMPISANAAIDINQISHVIDKMELVGTTIYAKIRILDTPNGNILERMLINEVPIVFRTAGLAKLQLREDGCSDITEYSLISVNAVSDPL